MRTNFMLLYLDKTSIFFKLIVQIYGLLLVTVVSVSISSLIWSASCSVVLAPTPRFSLESSSLLQAHLQSQWTRARSQALDLALEELAKVSFTKSVNFSVVQARRLRSNQQLTNTHRTTTKVESPTTKAHYIFNEDLIQYNSNNNNNHRQFPIDHRSDNTFSKSTLMQQDVIPSKARSRRHYAPPGDKSAGLYSSPLAAASVLGMSDYESNGLDSMQFVHTNNHQSSMAQQASNQPQPDDIAIQSDEPDESSSGSRTYNNHQHNNNMDNNIISINLGSDGGSKKKSYHQLQPNSYQWNGQNQNPKQNQNQYSYHSNVAPSLHYAMAKFSSSKFNHQPASNKPPNHYSTNPNYIQSLMPTKANQQPQHDQAFNSYELPHNNLISASHNSVQFYSGSPAGSPVGVHNQAQGPMTTTSLDWQSNNNNNNNNFSSEPDDSLTSSMEKQTGGHPVEGHNHHMNNQASSSLQLSTTNSQLEAPSLASSCGRQQLTNYREPRIVGGNRTYEGEFPWAVSIQRHGNHHCGGVIVGKRWILTAAHCVRSQHVANLLVRTGGHTLSRSLNSLTSHLERDYPVQQIIMHNDFSKYDNLTSSQLKSSANTNNADIALLRLRNEIQWNELVWPVCFPHRESGNFSGHDAIVIGWGKLTEKSDDFSNELQKVKLNIIDNKLCQNWFRQAGRDMPIDERIICAGFKSGGKDACHGDSGGPLLSKVNGQFTVVGVVSTGIGCARPLLPGLYSRVSSYVDWIEAHVSSR